MKPTHPFSFERVRDMIMSILTRDAEEAMRAVRDARQEAELPRYHKPDLFNPASPAERHAEGNPMSDALSRLERSPVNEALVESLSASIKGAVMEKLHLIPIKTLHSFNEWNQIFADVVSPIEGIVANALSVPPLEDGIPDRTTLADVASVLDELEVPSEKDGLRMTLAGRVHHLGDLLEEERGLVEELQADAESVSLDFEKDLWKAMRRILDRLKFDWSGVGSEGVTADEAEDFVMDALTALERAARPKQKPLSLEVTGMAGKGE